MAMSDVKGGRYDAACGWGTKAVNGGGRSWGDDDDGDDDQKGVLLKCGAGGW
jgi:hypothetical protein